MSDKAKIRMRLRCPQCGSLDSIKWGVRDGIQRYKCSCGYLFSGRRKEIMASNHFVWFKKWVSGRMAIDEIADRSGYSTRQLHRWFDEYLDSSPSWTMNTSRPIYLLIDGTYYLLRQSLSYPVSCREPEKNHILSFYQSRRSKWDCRRFAQYQGLGVRCHGHYHGWRRQHYTSYRIRIPWCPQATLRRSCTTWLPGLYYAAAALYWGQTFPEPGSTTHRCAHR